MAKIVLTGGGTAGHVTANLALIPGLKERKHRLFYIGSEKGIEKELAEKAGLPYYGIATGKFRRYFSLQNFTDPFKVIAGFFQARKFLKKEKINLVFSKGGFVAVPVVYAAASLGIPVICHESDMTPGLANRLSYSAATKICCNFPETLSLLPKDKAVLTGSPIRAELLSGNRETALALTGFSASRPVLLVIGGSLGSRAVNAAVRDALPDLLKEFQVLHIAGKNNLDPALSDTPGYRQFEYVSEELKDYFALADIMVSRAGANAICEILALRKPNVLIPLSAKASRGDQILNARSYEKQGYSRVLEEEALSRDTLLAAVRETYADRARYLAAMEAGGSANGVAQVMSVLNSVTAGRR